MSEDRLLRVTPLRTTVGEILTHLTPGTVPGMTGPMCDEETPEKTPVKPPESVGEVRDRIRESLSGGAERVKNVGTDEVVVWTGGKKYAVKVRELDD